MRSVASVMCVTVRDGGGQERLPLSSIPSVRATDRVVRGTVIGAGWMGLDEVAFSEGKKILSDSSVFHVICRLVLEFSDRLFRVVRWKSLTEIFYFKK